MKDKFEKLKAKWRWHKTLHEEQTNGFGSMWSWFDRVKSIMGGSGKEDGLEGGINLNRSTWKAYVNDWVSEKQSNHLLNFPLIRLDEDNGVEGD